MHSVHMCTFKKEACSSKSLLINCKTQSSWQSSEIYLQINNRCLDTKNASTLFPFQLIQDPLSWSTSLNVGSFSYIWGIQSHFSRASSVRPPSELWLGSMWGRASLVVAPRLGNSFGKLANLPLLWHFRKNRMVKTAETIIQERVKACSLLPQRQDKT